MENLSQNTEPKKVSPALAMIFSLFPGVGHLYLGLFNKGVFLMVVFTLPFLTIIEVGPLSVVVVFYAAFDALHTAKSINEGKEPVDLDLAGIYNGNLPKNWTTIFTGIVLLCFGVIFLLRNFGIIFNINLFWPLLLIALGFWLIINYFRDGGD